MAALVVPVSSLLMSGESQLSEYKRARLAASGNGSRYMTPH